MTDRKPDLLRRRLALAAMAYPSALVLQSCAAPFTKPSSTTSTSAARSVLSQSAEAHGSVAFDNLQDVSVSYAGKWRAAVGKLQPELVDPSFRGGSEERLLLNDGIVSQRHTGPSGHKQVVRTRAPLPAGNVRVWRNGNEDETKDGRDAAALVADGYSLFLLGPMLLSSHWLAEHIATMELQAVHRIRVDSLPYECDALRIQLRPGFGFSVEDDLTLFIDRASHLMRRVRFTLNGLDSTRGGVAEVDVARYMNLQGINWPTHYYERLLRPLPLPVHEWHLTGLDFNRGLIAPELMGSNFLGKAVAPAASTG